MKKTLTTYDIARELLADERAAWSYAGAMTLAEWLEASEEASGEEMELDIVAIRCEFGEHASLIAWASEYWGDAERASAEIGLDSLDEGERNEKIRLFVQDRGELLEFDGGIIVSNF